MGTGRANVGWGLGVTVVDWVAMVMCFICHIESHDEPECADSAGFTEKNIQEHIRLFCHGMSMGCQSPLPAKPRRAQ